MAGKKDPSIYDDRSNIGSSEELDEYGVWVKSEPQDLSSAMPEMEELPDFDGEMAGGMDLPDFDDAELPVDAELPAETELPADADVFAPEVEFEEIPEDSDLPEGQNPIGVDKDGFTEVSMTDFLDEEELESASSGIDIGDLDSIPDIPEEVPEIVNAPGNKASAAPPASELSTQLLMKIADELSSIKKELSSLKSELSSVRNAQADAQDASGGGFFDEEDDEKIALTGDELDNILNTANFTEEAGSGESVEEDLGSFENLDAAESDSLSDKPGIIEDEAPFGQAETPEQEETIEFEDNFDSVKPSGGLTPEPVEEINDDFDVSLDLSEDLTGGFADAESTENQNPDDGLGALREEGVKPMTKVEGDTSYLEEDPLASIPEDEQIDFSGAVIDEPDLSSGITENPIEDPSIENISIDLDMEEPVSSGTGGGDFNLEREDTMEIPVMEEPLIDDFFPISESAESDTFAVEPVTADEPVDFGAEVQPESDTFAVEPVAEEPADFDVEVPAEPDAFSVESMAVEEPSGFGAEVPAAGAPAEVPTAVEPVLSSEHENESGIPSNLKQELKTVLSYMDQLLESLPEDKIEEFAKSEYFDTYKKLFEELGLV